eukprot:13149999-Alexandrium_andersonii.AAC.1
MSASLVGSEMCIRDRQRRTRTATPRRRGSASARPGGRWPCSSRGSEVGACLLYTSDAADDM